MKSNQTDVRSGAKEPMSNPKSSLSNEKYSPTGKGGSKSEGPISKDEKNISIPLCK